jgi:hypothetical protein
MLMRGLESVRIPSLRKTPNTGDKKISEPRNQL